MSIAVADVRPFIERSQDLELMTLPNLEKLPGRSQVQRAQEWGEEIGDISTLEND